jgi:hypothetical protein
MPFTEKLSTTSSQTISSALINSKRDSSTAVISIWPSAGPCRHLALICVCQYVGPISPLKLSAIRSSRSCTIKYSISPFAPLLAGLTEFMLKTDNQLENVEFRSDFRFEFCLPNLSCCHRLSFSLLSLLISWFQGPMRSL